MIFFDFGFENYKFFLYNTAFIVLIKDIKAKGAVLWAAFVADLECKTVLITVLIVVLFGDLAVKLP